MSLLVIQCPRHVIIALFVLSWMISVVITIGLSLCKASWLLIMTSIGFVLIIPALQLSNHFLSAVLYHKWFSTENRLSNVLDVKEVSIR